MKYIFRYSILASYPHPTNKISAQQLQYALSEVKFPTQKYDVTLLQKLSIQCIQKILTKPQEKPLNIIEDFFASHSLSEIINSKQLQAIYQQQKPHIYKCIISSSTGSSYTFGQLQWSVKNIIMRKNQSSLVGGSKNTNNVIVNIKFNCFENGTLNKKDNIRNQAQNIVVKKGKQELQNMWQELIKCQTAINQILLSTQ